MAYYAFIMKYNENLIIPNRIEKKINRIFNKELGLFRTNFLRLWDVNYKLVYEDNKIVCLFYSQHNFDLIKDILYGSFKGYARGSLEFRLEDITNKIIKL